MDKELAEGLRELNGKQVWYVYEDGPYEGLAIKCIILATPEKGLSVKPYGYTPEELFQKYVDYNPDGYRVRSDVEELDFCLSSVTPIGIIERPGPIGKMVKLKDNAQFHYNYIVNNGGGSFLGPSCGHV